MDARRARKSGRHIKCVHLAGTNGKGSTLTYMRYMLEGAKYKVGTFTSL